jgi:predicted transcriptional regulator
VEQAMESTTVTVRLSSEVKDKLDLLAERTRRSKSFLAAEAIEGYVARELEIVAGIERGLDDMGSGRVVSHEEAMRRIRATISKARSAT